MKLLVFLLLPCLSLSELVPGFLQCRQFFLKDGPPQFTVPASIKEIPVQYRVKDTKAKDTTVKHISSKEICQCVWDDSNQKKYIYATLYNTEWRIPIYSAYVFRSAIVRSVGRCDAWYIEPQLDDPNGDACMASQSGKTINNQAENCDYEGQKPNEPNKPKYDKGHLYPVQHTNNHLSMLATSTLTNAAPQDSHFNRGQWSQHEEKVIPYLEYCDGEAYVVTGVVPDTNIPKLKNNVKPDIKNPQRYNRVTVSKYYWRAYCCLKNGDYIGQGYIGPDNNKVVEELSITDLQTRLEKEYGVNIKIFPGLTTPILRPPKLTHSGRKRPWEDDNQIDDHCNQACRTSPEK